MPRSIVAVLFVFAMLALSAPALAGGWATVRLDEPPGDVSAGTPFRFGFMVLQHDIHPSSDVTPIVRAIHKESGEEITTTAHQDGPVGHFVAELILPQAGEWKWEIRPEPFAETSFEALMVFDGSGATMGLHPATIHSGDCANLGDAAFALGEVEAQPFAVTSTQAPVAVGTSTIDVSLGELASAGHAISVADHAKSAVPLACGEIVGSAGGDELVVGLQPWNGSGDAGIAVLREKGDRTEVTLYLLSIAPHGGEPLAPTKTETIEIVDGNWFQPRSLEAEPGTTITWVNNSKLVHTVTGDDLAFDDSGLIEPGQSFSITFDEPGTYSYRCAPHPGMEGTIVII